MRLLWALSLLAFLVACSDSSPTPPSMAATDAAPSQPTLGAPDAGSYPRADAGRDSGTSSGRDSGTNPGRDGSGPVNAAPVDAAPCDDLPAPGTWENITPHGSGSKGVNDTVAAAIVVDPFDPRTVWLGTGSENDEIWRSDDCGASWTRVNLGPGSVGDGMSRGGVGDGAQWSMMVDPVDPGVVYAVSGYGAESLWKSTDGGRSWSDLLSDTEYGRHAGYVNNLEAHPDVRVRMHRQWRAARAQILDDDDAQARLESFHRRSHEAAVRQFGTDLLTIQFEFPPT